MRLVLIAALAIVALGGCASGALLLQRPEQDCINPSVKKVNEFNFFPEDYRSFISEPDSSTTADAKVEDAADFDIKYYGTYKVVEVKRFNKAYVLYQCGTPNPMAAGGAPPRGVKPGTPAFEVPLYSVAAADTTVNGFLSELNLVDRVALASPYSVDSCFQRLVDTRSQDGCKLVTPDPYYDAADKAAAARFKEANASMYAGADAVFVGYNASAPKDVLFPVTADPGPLNRAEWVKFVAAFFNKEVDANAAYSGIKGTYNSIKRLVAAKRAEPGADAAPKVAWVSTNASGIAFRLDPYKVALVQDAGGVPFTRAELERYGTFHSDPLYGTRYVFMAASNDAARYNVLSDADVLIDETPYSGAAGPVGLSNVSRSLGFWSAKDAADAVPAFATGDVYRWDGEQSPTGSSGWLERAVARPDHVLMDLARVLAPAVLTDALNVTNHLANSGPAGTDFNYLLQVGDAGDRGRPRVTAAKLCTTIPSCRDRTAFAICPNAYRDCSTGAVRAADPAQRCNAWAVCDNVDDNDGSGGGKRANGAAAHGGGVGGSSGAVASAVGAAAAVVVAALL